MDGYKNSTFTDEEIDKAMESFCAACCDDPNLTASRYVSTASYQALMLGGIFLERAIENENEERVNYWMVAFSRIPIDKIGDDDDENLNQVLAVIRKAKDFMNAMLAKEIN